MFTKMSSALLSHAEGLRAWQTFGAPKVRARARKFGFFAYAKGNEFEGIRYCARSLFGQVNIG